MYCIHLTAVFPVFSQICYWSMERGGEHVPDCTSCRLVGAGGCFAGALYAVYERSKLPATNRNRHWLTAIGVGRCTSLMHSPLGSALD